MLWSSITDWEKRFSGPLTVTPHFHRKETGNNNKLSILKSVKVHATESIKLIVSFIHYLYCSLGFTYCQFQVFSLLEPIFAFQDDSHYQNLHLSYREIYDVLPLPLPPLTLKDAIFWLREYIFPTPSALSHLCSGCEERKRREAERGGEN